MLSVIACVQALLVAGVVAETWRGRCPADRLTGLAEVLLSWGLAAAVLLSVNGFLGGG